tara:strand:- start:6101 stop:13282 length:7182 start_codon:yes stop_codon:yes gene_type:complete
MAIYLDFVGLNTLIQEPVSGSTNTIGYPQLVEETLDSPLRAIKCPNTEDKAFKHLVSQVDSTNFVSTDFIATNFWLKLDIIDSDSKIIIEAKDSGNNFCFEVSIRDNNKLKIILFNSSGQAKTWTSISLPEEQLVKWSHFNISINRDDITQSPKAYFNNVDIGSLTGTGSGTGSLRSLNTGGNIYILGTNLEVTGNELKGSMFDLSFWNVNMETATDDDGNILRTEIFEKGLNGESDYDLSDGFLVYWRLGDESQFDNFSVGSKHILGTQIPNPTTINPTFGSMTMVAKDNIYITEAFQRDYNVQNPFIEDRSSQYAFGSLGIYKRDYLAALNIHRNGPYGFSSFKQVRSSQNPLTRHHRKTSTFSYVLDGNTIKTNGNQVFKEKRTGIRQVIDSPIVSNNKPLTVIGGVSDYNRRTGKTTIERVEVQSSFNNETQFFGDEQTNREFGLELETHETYEDLTELYLDGGIESDDSPLDQFELLRYQHIVFPKESNSYLGHVRGRPNFVSGYWRDLRSDRTETNISDNGFGFPVPSQSMWPLDVEENWETRDLEASTGFFTMSSPSNFVYNTTPTPANADGFFLPNYPEGTSGLKIYAHKAGHTELSGNYDPVGATAEFYGKKYGMNSRSGTLAFYDKWVETIENVGIKTVSTSSNILTRHNVNSKNSSMASNHPFFMQINTDSHFTTDLSCSYLHFWLKDEVTGSTADDRVKGVIYSERYNAHNHNKRKVYFTGSDNGLVIEQGVRFTRTEEDYSTTTLRSDIKYTYLRSTMDTYRGDEWNNYMVRFGKPEDEGQDCIDVSINGKQLSGVFVNTDDFFSGSVLNTNAIVSKDQINTKNVIVKKTQSDRGVIMFYKSGYSPTTSLEAVQLDRFRFNQNDCWVTFYMKSDYNFVDGDQVTVFDLVRQVPDDFGGTSLPYSGTKTDYGRVNFSLVADTDGGSIRVSLRVRFEDSTTSGNFLEKNFDITDFIDKTTKYVYRFKEDPSNTNVLANHCGLLWWHDEQDKDGDGLRVGLSHTTSQTGTTKIAMSSDGFNLFTVSTNSSKADSLMLSDIAFFDVSNAAQGGSSLHSTGSTTTFVLEILNTGATVDFTSSYWTGSLGFNKPKYWYRLEADSSALGMSLSNGSTHAAITSLPATHAAATSVITVATNVGSEGSAYDLTTDYAWNVAPVSPNEASSLGDPAQATSFFTTNLEIQTSSSFSEQIPKSRTRPSGFATGSISAAYVLCRTGSQLNAGVDFFRNASIAEFALIPSASGFDLSDYIPVDDGNYDTKKYTFKDLSTTTVPASIWYAFDSSDSITETAASIENKNASYSQFNISTTYSAGSGFPTIENDGLETGSTMEMQYKIKFVEQDPQELIRPLGTAIPSAGFSSSALTTEFPSDYYIGGNLGYNSSFGAGILMNSYNSFNIEPIPTDDGDPATTTDHIDNYLSSACLYARRHTLKHSSSLQHPMLEDDFYLNSTLEDLEDFELYQGMAKWDAGDQSGKKPFYDEYKDFSKDIRLINKDYSLVPEYKISDHIDKFLLKGDTQFEDTDFPMLSVTGGHADKSNSNLDGFYETYSTTDFLKMFDLIQEEHDGFVNPISLKLKCKGVKKFLPYKGFYPADRTVQISQQFYDSYGDSITIDSAYAGESNFAFQNLVTPLFSPGILFNTIKAGVACDYPMMTGSFTTETFQNPEDLSDKGTHHIAEQFHKRIPFEALIEPEKHLSNQRLYTQEPDPLGNHDFTVTWNGQGDEKYRLMMSNFLAETGEFFLKNKDYASISSLPEGDPNFGNAEAGKTYMMRIKMFRTIDGNKPLWDFAAGKGKINYVDPQPNGSFTQPQDLTGVNLGFSMYSRPSAFGPPQRIHFNDHTASNLVKFTNWSDFKRKEGSIDTFYNVFTQILYSGDASALDDLDVASGHSIIGNDADSGYNYPFTPPYYHGDAWADVTFTATDNKKLTLSEIINSSSVEFLRYYEPVLEKTESGQFTNWRLVNEEAMQLASSVNIFSRGVLKKDITETKRRGIRNDVQVQVDTNIGNQYRWIIQSKYETPILNFKKYNLQTTGTVTIPTAAPNTTPIGMWHQYGELPQRAEEGIFLQVTDVPDDWIDNAMNAKAYETGSLVELCGFSTDPVRLGEVSPTKTIKEAVVAVPFIEKQGQRNFFTIDREDIANALEPSTKNLVGKTIQDMVQRMKDYVFPPSMDFINNDDIDPFAMYIFEFKHTLDKQDLADIWQNLPPDIATQQEEAEAEISHELLSHELLGAKADLKPGRNTEFELNRQVRKDKIDSKIRWMVFKVKQRAKNSYFEKIFARNESQESNTELRKTTLSSVGQKKNIGYNWPYDYFSLVELIKMEAEIDFARPDDENQEEKLVIKPYTKIASNAASQTLISNALFGTEFEEPELNRSMIQESIPTGKKKK